VHSVEMQMHADSERKVALNDVTLWANRRWTRDLTFLTTCPDPWPFAPQISRLRRVSRSTTVPSLKPFRSGVFVLSC